MDSALVLETARNIATVAGAILAAVGVPLALMSLWANQKNVRARVHIDLLQLLEGKENELEEIRTLLELKVREAKASSPERSFDINHLTEDEAQNVKRLAREYDKVGLLVKFGTIPTDFLFEFYSRPIVTGWKYLQDYIQQERRTRPQPTHMLKFEALAFGASEYRRSKYPSQTPIEISVSAEARNEWRRWNLWKK